MSFSTALSGLAANNAALNVVGNNLANLNTQSFKADAVQFKDVMGQTSGSTAIGAGVASPLAVKQFTQGSIQTTTGLLDTAIQGSGFFVVRDDSGNNLYTRSGSLRVNEDGLLVTATGERLQGWSAAGGVLNPSGAVSDISISAQASQPPIATTAMTLSLNLDAAAAVDATFATPIQVVDTLGVTHVLTATFTKTAANAWDYEISIPGEDVTGGTAGTPEVLANGTLQFDSDGLLTSPAAGSPIAVATSGGLESGAADLSIEWSLYRPNDEPLISQYAQASAASGATQNGQEAAQLNSVRIGDGGLLIASYSSGRQTAIAQLALASIGNPDSMVAVGNNNYQLGPDTLTPVIGVAGTGGRGQIVGSAIESSNVDLAREFTNLIVYQRGYQANSKVISTIDQITQTLLNIKP